MNLFLPGALDYFDSYGLIGCQLVRELAAMGVVVNVFGMLGENWSTTPADIRAAVDHPVQATLGGVYLGYPSNYHKHRNPLGQIGPRVALTMFESSKIPASWVEPLNACDAVITPSRFCLEIFRNAGVTAPIHVIPLGVNKTFRPAKRPVDRPLTFLAFRDRGLRKGGYEAQQAFLQAFGDREDVRLILKMRIPKVKEVLLNKNITLIQRDMPEEELCKLYCQCDVLISASTGEGFGLIPREFAATGGVSLATGWSGSAEDIDLWGVPLPYRLVTAEWNTPALGGQDLGEWAQVDREALVALLRDIAFDREGYLAQAEAKAARVGELYSWRRFAEGVLEVWREVAGGIHQHMGNAAA